ncbi:MAG TPA: FixH family protein [Gallionella sp.]|nr:FixH family protein [Gallionella sp.]
MISQESKKAWSNPWALGFMGFIVLVVTVNGLFIWFTQHNRFSLVDHEYSTKDRKSDTNELKEIEAHRALGWKTSIKVPKGVVMNSPAAYEISVVDRDNAPVSGTMEVEAYRAADASKDFTTPFKEVSPGTYQGSISFPLKGFWELRIRVKRGDEVFGVDTKRFEVAPAP